MNKVIEEILNNKEWVKKQMSHPFCTSNSFDVAIESLVYNINDDPKRYYNITQKLILLWLLDHVQGGEK